MTTYNDLLSEGSADNRVDTSCLDIESDSFEDIGLCRIVVRLGHCAALHEGE
jgi:hypothetical protein